MIRIFIIFCSFFAFSIQAEELSVVAPFMPEAQLAKSKIKSSSSSKKDDSNSQAIAQDQSNTEEDYRPSLTESLNDSNSQKNKIKRQLSADSSQTNPEESASEEEVANFGNISVSISERKKEEKLRKVNNNN